MKEIKIILALVYHASCKEKNIESRREPIQLGEVVVFKKTVQAQQLFCLLDRIYKNDII